MLLAAGLSCDRRDCTDEMDERRSYTETLCELLGIKEGEDIGNRCACGARDCAA